MHLCGKPVLSAKDFVTKQPDSTKHCKLKIKSFGGCMSSDVVQQLIQKGAYCVHTVGRILLCSTVAFQVTDSEVSAAKTRADQIL